MHYIMPSTEAPLVAGEGGDFVFSENYFLVCVKCAEKCNKIG